MNIYNIASTYRAAEPYFKHSSIGSVINYLSENYCLIIKQQLLLFKTSPVTIYLKIKF